MRTAVSILLVLAASALACSDYYGPPLEDIVSSSDLIVRGELKKIRRFKRGTSDWAAGEIVAVDVLWGDVRPGEKLVLTWPVSKSPCDYSHAEESERMAVWCLTFGPDNEIDVTPSVVVASQRPPIREALPEEWRTARLVQARLWPGYAQPNEAAARIRSLISSNPVCLRLRRLGPRITDLFLEVVFRNPGTVVASYPGMVRLGDTLLVSSSEQLELREVFPLSDPEKHAVIMAPKVNAVSVVTSLPNLAIPPMGEYRIKIRVADLFPINVNTPYDAILRVSPRVLTKRLFLFEKSSPGRR